MGTVRNETDGELKFIKVVAIGRDGGGNPVGFGTSYATSSTLAAGAESGFKVRCGVWHLEDPKTWEVVAFGKP